MGLSNDGKSYPVFVQRHALDNLYSNPKEARALFLEDGDWLVHDYLWQSLRNPKIRPMAGHLNKYLVEYWLNVHKLGYLVVERLDDAVLVKTFLFLTMNGTPEGDALYNKLKLRKPDKQSLELDRIQTFLFSDVQFDTELVNILGECGCGHLFRILKEPPADRIASGYASRFRHYIGLGNIDQSGWQLK